MPEVKITDLVAQETIDKLKELDREMQAVVDSYTNTARELAKGLQLEVKVIGDIDKLDKMFIEKAKESEENTKRLTKALDEQNAVLGNTTNTISRQLMEQERVNKATRDAYTESEKFHQLMDQVNGSYGERVKRLVELEREIESAKKKEKDLNDSLKKNIISQETYVEKMSEAKMHTRQLVQEKSNLTTWLKNEEREMQSVDGSYNNFSQRLELMKKAYKDLTEEERQSAFGRELETNIQNLDAHLKDVAADMGEFQRNVGNYAIAGQNGVVATESVVAALQQEAITTQDLIDQTKILEEAKLRLNTSDENYQQTLEALNAKIEENKTKLSDVSDIMNKEATSVAEAESQNKRLQEALKHVDVTSDGAQKTIAELNAKIQQNTQFIERNSPALKKNTSLLEKHRAELEAQKKTNEDLAGRVLNLVGVNSRFGSSLQGLGAKGSVFDGLKTKVGAFGKTLTGLLSNPWVLSFLGIAGVAAGFKWWYDYNKGLAEASRLTKNFLGVEGDTADRFTARITALADTLGNSYEETINAANKMVQNYGISWNEALDTMEKGYAAGANMSGKMVENIDRFTPALRDAGISASELVAILSNTRAGIFDEKGVQNILKGGTRLRSMTKNIAADLDAVGISSTKMQKDLTEGNITMMEALQQVASKLKELPANSQEAGKIMKDVFGRTAAEGGELLIQSIADLNTNLDECIENMGEMGRLNQEQMETQKELQETLAAVFKMSGTSFEEMTARAKIYLMKGLIQIIKGTVDLINYFIDLYNESEAVRLVFNAIGGAFKNLWSVIKGVLSQIYDAFKALGDIIKDIFTGNFDEIAGHYAKGVAALKKNIKVMASEIKTTYKEGFSNSKHSHIERLSYEYDDNLDVANGYGSGLKNGKYSPSGDGKDKNGKKDKKSKSDADKRAREELKILQNLEDAKIDLMEEGHEKELALIRQKYKKKIDSIKGNSENEQALRIAYAEKCEKEVALCEERYQSEMSRINLANRLAYAEQGSKRYLDLRLAQLEAERKQELEEAEKTGADVSAINAKFDQMKLDETDKYVEQRSQLIEKAAAYETAQINNEYMAQIVALKQKHNDEIKAAGDNIYKREALEKQYEKDMAALNIQMVEATIDAEIEKMERILAIEELSAEERLKIEQELTAKKLELQDQLADYTATTNEDTNNELQDWLEKNLDLIEKFASGAAEIFSSINDLVQSVYDRQIQKIEEASQTNQEEAQKESDLITELVNKKVITEEEGEARKRALEAETAKKEEEFARKKRDLQLKQAKWDKANSLAQATISTALAVLNALQTQPFWLGLAMAAIAATTGAMQIATIASTPIPAYKEGTDYHKGGLALVGDGGKNEVIQYRGSMWLTPDIPTLVDIPKGATVFPDVESLAKDIVSLPALSAGHSSQVKAYDDRAMRKVVSEVPSLLKTMMRQQHADAVARRYDEFKSRI